MLSECAVGSVISLSLFFIKSSLRLSPISLTNLPPFHHMFPSCCPSSYSCHHFYSTISFLFSQFWYLNFTDEGSDGAEAEVTCGGCNTLVTVARLKDHASHCTHQQGECMDIISIIIISSSSGPIGHTHSLSDLLFLKFPASVSTYIL